MALFTKYFGLYRLNPGMSLLFNTLTGAKNIVDESTRGIIEQLIAGNFDCECPADLRAQLEKRGYLFDSEEKERELLDLMHEKTKEANKKTIFPNYTICPTMGCNLRCVYCFENNDLHKEYGVMSEEQLESILSMIRESYHLTSEKSSEQQAMEAKNRENEPCEKQNSENEECENGNDNINSDIGTLTLFGGEPLLPTNRKIIERIYEFANEWNFQVDIITNGTSISAYADLLKENADRTLIQITLDGDKEIHDKRRIRADGSGTFDKVCEGVTEALKIGIQVSLRVNVDRSNLYSLPRLKELFIEKRWTDYPNFDPYLSPVECYEESGDHDTVTDADILEYCYENGLYGNDDQVFSGVGPTAAMIEDFFRNMSWRTTYCGATLGLDYVFTPNGNVYPCLTHCGNDQHMIGTYRDGEVFLNERYDKWKNRDPFEMKNCKDCKYLLLCSGGCPARPNADAENCLIRPTFDRIFEMFVDHNRDNFLKEMEEKKRMQAEARQEKQA